jgi:hypothetical protein
MNVRRIAANGVPWLVWFEDDTWRCEACGASGRQPPYRDVASFARWLGDTKRAHVACSSGREAAFGDPLNHGRAEQ